MPPKRKRRNSNSGLAVGEHLNREQLRNPLQPWGWIGTEVHNISEITHEQMLFACGLSTRSKHSVCENRYAPKDTGASQPLDADIIDLTVDHPCDKKLCKANPNCLNFLGQEKWEAADNARTSFLKLANLGDDPLLDGREPGIPIGLKNLGATCFANACLQVWFQDLAFRNGVYSCQPSSDTEEKFEESPIFQLQVTFTALTHGAKNVFNPEKLVESLKLVASEQQDAQEFSKLFMSHLDAEFQKQPDPRLRSLIADQFQGKQVYGTICEACHHQSERATDFLELEITFEANAKLEDRIAALLQKERLSGDNQYLCPSCEGLQDATRYTQLRSLPPVLHFSLLRFTYDFNTMERKKSKQSLSFPKTLDMSRFVQSDYGEPTVREGSNVYELRGILLHKGTSAYHGHYEAQVFDVSSGTWFQFNDEIVTETTHLGDKKQAIINVDEDDDDDVACGSNNRKKRTKNARKRQRVQDSDDEESTTLSATSFDEIKSKDAYMLIFARRPEKPAEDISLTSPTRALEVVRTLNDSYEQECESFSIKEKLLRITFTETRRKVLDIYRSWCEDRERSCIVSKQALETFLSTHAMQSALNQIVSGSTSVVSSPTGSTDSQDTKVSKSTTISLEDILCNHGKLSPTPSSVESMKRISQHTCDKILELTNCKFESVLHDSDICADCVSTIFAERLYRMQHPAAVARFVSMGPAKAGSKGFWISNQWIRDWKLVAPKMRNLQDPSPRQCDSDVVCSHGGLSAAVNTRHRISIEAVAVLKESFPDWDPLFSTDTQVCPECANNVSTSKENTLELRKEAETEKVQLKSMLNIGITGSLRVLDDVPCAIVPVEFLSSWRKWIVDRTATVQRPGQLNNASFICPHDMLNFDPNAPGDLDDTMVMIKRSDWDILESRYDARPRIDIEKNNETFAHTTPVCHNCRTRRKTNYEKCTITVRILSAKDTIPNPTEETDNAVVAPNQQKSALRQSKRLRDNKGNVSIKTLAISKTTTVLDMKLLLQSQLSVPAIYQRLFYKGNELEDNKATAEALLILANDTLDLREEKEDEEGKFGSDSEEAHVRKKAKEEGGFGGTLLLGNSSSKPPSSDESSPPPAAPKERNCPACTFANAFDAVNCAICDTIFVCN